MTGALGGRIAIVTGGGRGLGREHALLLAAEGARVVVNDVDREAVDTVVEEIRSGGGEASADHGDVADWDGGRRLVEAAIEAYGDLHVLVNNAGNLRDRWLTEMTGDEWDDVVRVHLRGHFVPTRWASAHWKAQAKAGRPVAASVVNTTSTSGLVGQPGQTNYGAAKAGIAAFTVIAAAELGRFGVRVNAVAPLARTRMTESAASLAAVVAAPADPDEFDVWHPANVSPVVAWLATEGCSVTGEVLLVQGGLVQRFRNWSLDDDAKLARGRRWTVADLARSWPRPGG